MKKLLVIPFCICFFIAFTSVVGAEQSKTIVNENGIEINGEQYNRLIDLGFSDREIQMMEQDEFNINKDLEGQVVSETTKYYEVKEMSSEGESSLQFYNYKENTNLNEGVELSKDEYEKRLKNIQEKENAGIRTLSSTDTGYTAYKTMTTKIIKLRGGTYRVRNDVKWDRIPKTRSYDVIGVAINPNFFKPVNTQGTYYGKQMWEITQTNFGFAYYGSAIYNHTSNKWSKGGEGYGVKMNLKNNLNSAEIVTGLSMYMYYEVDKATYNIRPTSLDAYGRYAHAEKNVSLSYSFGITWGAPSISFSGVSSTSFSIQKNTHASLPL